MQSMERYLAGHFELLKQIFNGKISGIQYLQTAIALRDPTASKTLLHNTSNV
ncbi:MAG: hypothetical protein PUP93_29005 [Rhizonema sp. NSF051]|nr:hypothetical protein [Rhizonema sp. NSF051]